VSLLATKAAELELQLAVNIKAPFAVAKGFLPADHIGLSRERSVCRKQVHRYRGVDPFDPDHREGFIPRAEMLRPADVAEAILFVATRPPHVLIDWLRLGPTGKRARHG
jgi:hypothetical protein